MSRSANISANCPACKKPNEDGMHFCIFCGTVLAPQEAKRADRTCISCGRFDDHNVNFCIYCGANTTIGVSYSSQELSSPTGFESSSRHTAVIPDQPSSPSSKVASSKAALTKAQSNKSLQSATKNRVKAVKAEVLEKERAKQSAPKAPPKQNTLLWVAAGAVTGVALAAAAFQFGAMTSFARFCLPTKGLAIYTEKPYQIVLIEDQQSKNFTIGTTGKAGTLSIDDLPPGDQYRLRLEGQGFETVYFPPFTLEPRCASILGFPKKVALPPRHI